jgi:hypothetical protein
LSIDRDHERHLATGTVAQVSAPLAPVRTGTAQAQAMGSV